MFGNTRAVAETIGAVLAGERAVDVVEVATAPDVLPEDVDLVVVGAPTHVFGLSRASTRTSAAGRAPGGLVSTGRGVREWLDILPAAGSGVLVYAFDTKVKVGWLPGSAAKAIAKHLRRLRYTVPALTSFYVTGTPDHWSTANWTAPWRGRGDCAPRAGRDRGAPAASASKGTGAERATPRSPHCREERPAARRHVPEADTRPPPGFRSSHRLGTPEMDLPTSGRRDLSDLLRRVGTMRRTSRVSAPAALTASIAVVVPVSANAVAVTPAIGHCHRLRGARHHDREQHRCERDHR
ncbi:hypothetical protein [Actinosynnema sp. NPDC023587]|uniref:flavodoxin family protein n=1 Tax=Actinosynnema sp. NPDC023587 TaxID=3154695 RepID=UPI0033CF4AA1